MEIEGLDDLHEDSQQQEDLNDDIIEGSTTEGDGIVDDESQKKEEKEKGDSGAPPEDPEKGPESVDNSNLSGIEQYLSQFNIEGGIIEFQDGTKSHFNELPPEKQFDVLSKLHDVSAKSTEEKYGLDQEEINLINYVRQQDGTVNEVIDRLAQQRAQVYIAAQSIENSDIESMDADAVYTAFLMKSNPEATAEQIEHDLDTAKKMSNYEKVVANLKAGMLKEHKEKVEQTQREGKEQIFQEIESQRKEVVSAVSQLNELDGLTINDGIKNDVLDLILNVDEDGDSMFMTQVFSDPKELFKAAFWYKNGSDILRAREEYWKKEKSEAFKRGQATPASQKRTFTAADASGQQQQQNRTTPSYDEEVSLDDIHSI